MLAVCVLATGRFKGATLWMLAFILTTTPEAPTGSPCLSPPFTPPRTPPTQKHECPKGEERGLSAPGERDPPPPERGASAQSACASRRSSLFGKGGYAGRVRKVLGAEQSQRSICWLFSFPWKALRNRKSPHPPCLPSIAVLVVFIKREFVPLKPSFSPRE